MLKRRRTIEPLSAVLSGIAEVEANGNVRAFQRIVAHWPKICIALGVHRAEALDFKDGLLTVGIFAADNGERRQDRNILRQFGIRDVRFSQLSEPPMTKPSMTAVSETALQRTQGIQDEELQMAMTGLIMAYEKSVKKT